MQKRVSAYVTGLALLGLAISTTSYLLGLDLPPSVFVVSFSVVMIAGLASSIRREGGAKNEDIAIMVGALIFSGWLAYNLIH